MERLSYELLQEIDRNDEVELATIVNYVQQGSSLTTIRLKAALFALGVIPLALLRARDADVIHLGDPVLSLVGWLIKKLFHTPVTVTVHGLDVQYSSKLYQWYLRTFFRSFDMYYPISTYAASLLTPDISSDKVRVIPPGVHDRFYNSSISKLALSQLLGIDTNQLFIIGTAGRLVKRKGHAWFITEVLPHLPQHVHYVIAGDGPEYSAIEDAAQEAGVTSQVHMLGKVSDADLQIFYNTIDLFVQPNISVPGDAEGFGIVLNEAALCEKQVFASDIEGIPSAIQNGKNGYLFPAEEAAVWIEAITSALQHGGMRFSEVRTYTLHNFAWPVIASTYVNSFKTLRAPQAR